MDISKLSLDLYALADLATDKASQDYLRDVAYVLLSASQTGGVDRIGHAAKQQELCKSLSLLAGGSNG